MIQVVHVTFCGRCAYNNVVVVIGFENATYSVNECDGSITIGVEVKEGTLRTGVTVLLSTLQKNGSGKTTFV